MPAATNKADLLAVFDKEKQKLDATLDKVTEGNASLSAPDDSATIKGVIAHRIHWMAMFSTWYEDGKAGRTVHIPAQGYKWNQLKEYNATLYAEGNRAEWSDLLARFNAEADRLRSFTTAADEAELYDTGVWDWTGKWTLGRWLEASGPSHFRSANTYIRKVLKHAD